MAIVLLVADTIYCFLVVWHGKALMKNFIYAAISVTSFTLALMIGCARLACAYREATTTGLVFVAVPGAITVALLVYNRIFNYCLRNTVHNPVM